jgi:hypothetical protein
VEETDKGIKEIIDHLKCTKNFNCYKSGFDVLCKAKDVEIEKVNLRDLAPDSM